jgi:hypothetical protein
LKTKNKGGIFIESLPSDVLVCYLVNYLRESVIKQKKDKKGGDEDEPEYK